MDLETKIIWRQVKIGTEKSFRQRKLPQPSGKNRTHGYWIWDCCCTIRKMMNTSIVESSNNNRQPLYKLGESGQMCSMSRPRDFVPSARFLQKTMLLVPHKS